MNTFLIVGSAITLDLVTGVAKSIHGGAFKSSVMREGLWHKLSEVIALIVAYFVQYMLPYIGIPYSVPAVSVVTIYIVLMEVGSCLENLGEINPQLKEPLSKVFAQLKGGDNNETK